jgi:hypothetical protein
LLSQVAHSVLVTSLTGDDWGFWPTRHSLLVARLGIRHFLFLGKIRTSTGGVPTIATAFLSDTTTRPLLPIWLLLRGAWLWFVAVGPDTCSLMTWIGAWFRFFDWSWNRNLDPEITIVLRVWLQMLPGHVNPEAQGTVL